MRPADHPVEHGALGLDNNAHLHAHRQPRAKCHAVFKVMQLSDQPLCTSPLSVDGMMSSDFFSTGCSSGCSLENEVAIASNLLAMLVSGPAVPPLPPSGCYGNIFISSAISESLGAAAEAVAAAARELGDKPVKVLLPWYPTNAGTALFDHTKPAKVMIH